MAIDSLTPEQQARIPEYKERYLKYGLAFGETDEDKAEEALKQIWRDAGYEPGKIVWVDNPPIACKMSYAHENPNLSEEDVEKNYASHMKYACFGTMDAAWLIFYDFVEEVCGHPFPKLKGMRMAMRECGWYYMSHDVCYAARKPIHIGLQGEKLHQEGGKPAIGYLGGYNIYAIDGVTIPKEMGSIPADQWDPLWLINNAIPEVNTNAEVRRILFSNLNMQRLFKELPTKLIDSFDASFKNNVIFDDGSTGVIEIPNVYELYEVNGYKSLLINPETKEPYPLRLLTMKDSSTGKPYVFRADPKYKTAEEVVRRMLKGADPRKFRAQS